MVGRVEAWLSLSLSPPLQYPPSIKACPANCKLHFQCKMFGPTRLCVIACIFHEFVDGYSASQTVMLLFYGIMGCCMWCIVGWFLDAMNICIVVLCVWWWCVLVLLWIVIQMYRWCCVWWAGVWWSRRVIWRYTGYNINEIWIATNWTARAHPYLNQTIFK